jgi:uncharacterized protein YegP (UPF0339 family)
MPGKFCIKKGTTGKFRFVICSPNGQVVATSEAYNSKASAVNGVKAIQKIVPDAVVEDQTTKEWAEAQKAAAAKKAAAKKRAAAKKAAARKAAKAPGGEPAG